MLPIVARELPELPRPLKNWGAPWLAREILAARPTIGAPWEFPKFPKRPDCGRNHFLSRASRLQRFDNLVAQCKSHHWEFPTSLRAAALPRIRKS